MLILVYVRSRIEPTVYSANSLAALEKPQFQIDMFPDGSLDIDGTQTRIEAFSSYYFYPTSFTETGPVFETINIRNASTSPLMFNPPACMLNSSWVLPKVASSYIAIVGQDDNAVMQRINTYMIAL